MVSLDCPTSFKHPAGRKTFYDIVIEGLLAVERHRTFRQLRLAESQWEALKEQLAAARTGLPDLARLMG